MASAQAESEVSARALAAADALRAAISPLETAQSASDQVVALTTTIRAYENGLQALREGLRASALREAEIGASFEVKRDRLSQVLGAMMAMDRAPVPMVLLHPGGPQAAVQSAMLLQDVTPALQAEAEALRAELQEISDIKAAREAAAVVLRDGLTRVQKARTLLGQAVQDRTDLPERFLEDPEELRNLIETADTLDAFALGLSKIISDVGAPMGDFDAAKGLLGLPAVGSVIRTAGQADAAGIIRPGVLVATEAQALVTAPWPATIRYLGPLLDYENVMILEPKQDYLLVLAGLEQVYGQTGDVVPKGTPLGQMGGNPGTGAEYAAGFLAGAKEGGGAGRRETLYIELRYRGAAQDPMEWFRAPVTQ